MTQTGTAPAAPAARLTWTLFTAAGRKTVTHLKANGSSEQYIATAKALRSAGYTTIIDERGRCVFCDGRHCGANAR
jgi:hypothetical protein